MDTTQTTHRLTAHGLLRLHQRNLSAEQVDYVMSNGTLINRTGATFFVLRRADIPEEDRATNLARLEGTVVIAGRNGSIVTIYRAADPRLVCRVIKKKPDHCSGRARVEEPIFTHTQWLQAGGRRLRKE